jgi:putative tRNA adenosine deaminase-associated protein
MSYFAAVLSRSGERWSGDQIELDGCETLTDVVDLLRDVDGELRLLVLEQDDEYAALVRLDVDEEDPRAFLSDGRAADRYPLAALVAEELPEVGGDELEDDEDAPLAHDSAPFGDPDLVQDLGTPASDLLEMCEHQGTLPIDLVLAVCEKAGCGELFEDLHG